MLQTCYHTAVRRALRVPHTDPPNNGAIMFRKCHFSKCIVTVFILINEERNLIMLFWFHMRTVLEKKKSNTHLSRHKIRIWLEEKTPTVQLCCSQQLLHICEELPVLIRFTPSHPSGRCHRYLQVTLPTTHGMSGGTSRNGNKRVILTSAVQFCTTARPCRTALPNSHYRFTGAQATAAPLTAHRRNAVGAAGATAAPGASPHCHAHLGSCGNPTPRHRGGQE